MTLLAIHVGKPATHGADHISDKPWESGILKYPVEGRIWLDALNLDGDGQDDLKHHGGLFRAVLTYGAKHYPLWREELGRDDLAYGSFGENFTVTDLDEDSVCLGDIYQVGEVRLQVSQPRQPCWKLARRNGIKDLAERVREKGWGGWYSRVLQTGYVQAGDSVELLERTHPRYTITYLNELILKWKQNTDDYQELSTIEALSPQWRKYYGDMAE